MRVNREGATLGADAQGGLRIALVAPFGLQPKGTTSARVMPIARALARRGASVRVVIPPWDDPERAGACYEDHDVEVVHTRIGAPGLRAATILRDCWSSVQAFHPDVVHCFKPIGYSGMIAAELYSSPSPPRKGRGWGEGGPPRPRVIVDADDLEGPLGWAGRKPLGIAGRLRGIQERLVIRRVGRVTVASTWLAAFARQRGVQPAKRFLLPNGYDPNQISAHAAPAVGSAYYVWYTRFTEAEPARAARLLAPLLGSSDAPRLAILGEEVNAGDRAALHAALTAAGVAQYVDWLGYAPDALGRLVAEHGTNLIALYPLDDDLVNRARCPSKIPQLMAYGIPIVAEGVGEVARYLAGSYTDCVAQPGDPAAFQERACRLAANPSLRQTVGESLRIAAQTWTWDKVTGGLLEWYSCD